MQVWNLWSIFLSNWGDRTWHLLRNNPDKEHWQSNCGQLLCQHCWLQASRRIWAMCVGLKWCVPARYNHWHHTDRLRMVKIKCLIALLSILLHRDRRGEHILDLNGRLNTLFAFRNSRLLTIRCWLAWFDRTFPTWTLAADLTQFRCLNACVWYRWREDIIHEPIPDWVLLLGRCLRWDLVPNVPYDQDTS